MCSLVVDRRDEFGWRRVEINLRRIGAGRTDREDSGDRQQKVLVHHVLLGG